MRIQTTNFHAFHIYAKSMVFARNDDNIPQKFRFLKINTSLEAKIFQGSVQYR